MLLEANVGNSINNITKTLLKVAFLLTVLYSSTHHHPWLTMMNGPASTVRYSWHEAVSPALRNRDNTSFLDVAVRRHLLVRSRRSTSPALLHRSRDAGGPRRPWPNSSSILVSSEIFAHRPFILLPFAILDPYLLRPWSPWPTHYLRGAPLAW